MSVEADRPNIVFLFPDQFRADFAGCYGADWLRTPNIDAIVNSGVRYANGFSQSPVCVPARTALLTGANAIRNGVTNNTQNLRADWRSAGIQTWPELLNDAGYYTAGIGKMHFYPWNERRGFQYRVVCEDKRWLEVRDDYYHYLNGADCANCTVTRWTVTTRTKERSYTISRGSILGTTSSGLRPSSSSKDTVARVRSR